MDATGPLPSVVVKSLSDKVYDKRKAAAGEVAKIVKDLVAKEENEQIKVVISILTKQILDCNFYCRIGGLMGLAAVSLGLGQSTIKPLINELVNPVFPAFKDASPYVRYYATEALYNICIVSRDNMLSLVNEIFSIVAGLSMDKDQNVKSAADLLDKALKGIVAECHEFDLESFIPLLRERIYSTDSQMQTRVVSWVALLQSIPFLNLATYIPDILEGLFIILGSPEDDIKKMTDVVLQQFKNAINKKPDVIKYPDIINILVVHAQSTDALVQKTALSWIKDCVTLSKRQMLPYASGILSAALPCVALEGPQALPIKELAESVCDDVTLLIVPEDDIDSEGDTSYSEPEILGYDDQPLPSDVATNELHLDSVMDVIVEHVESAFPCKMMALKIIYHLNDKIPFRMQPHLNTLFDVLLKSIADPHDAVVLLVVQILAQIASSDFPRAEPSRATQSILNEGMPFESQGNLKGGKYFTRFIQELLRRFSEDRHTLKIRGVYVIRQLCSTLSSEEVYCKFAELILNETNLPFANEMVQSLSTILVTSKELYPLRLRLRTLDNKDSCEFFVKLYRSWCHDPVAALTLCFLAQQYEHSLQIVRLIAEWEASTDILMELDKLIHLVESPVFTFLRLQLLEPRKNPYLVEVLYGILMLLPQTEVFETLRKRLNCLPSPNLFELHGYSTTNNEFSEILNSQRLLKTLSETQERHFLFKKEEIIERLKSAMVITASTCE